MVSRKPNINFNSYPYLSINPTLILQSRYGNNSHAFFFFFFAGTKLMSMCDHSLCLGEAGFIHRTGWQRVLALNSGPVSKQVPGSAYFPLVLNSS